MEAATSSLTVDHPRELAAQVGRPPLTGPWRPVTQDLIDAFGTLTGDTHWIHMDPARAAAEGPFGGTIAHGFLTLAFLTSMLHGCLDIRGARRIINYGVDHVRFTHPVKPGDRLRLRLRIADVGEAGAGTRLTLGCDVEIAGVEKPALRADLILLVFAD